MTKKKGFNKHLIEIMEAKNARDFEICKEELEGHSWTKEVEKMLETYANKGKSSCYIVPPKDVTDRHSGNHIASFLREYFEGVSFSAQLTESRDAEKQRIWNLDYIDVHWW